MTPIDPRPAEDFRPGRSRYALAGLFSALFMAVFLMVAGAPNRAEAAALPAGAAQSAAPAGQNLLQDVQWRHYGYGHRPYYGGGYYRHHYGPRYGYYRPAYRPRVVCHVRYGAYGPRQVCVRRW
jgi:hypothetical protein